MTSSNTPESNPTPQNGAARLGRETVAGFAIVGVFLAGFVGWAALAPLESAAIAPGVVSVDGNRKTVQHLEGGIVGEILVREGERIAAGQVLIRLDDTTPRASLELLRGRWMVASALEARLEAERDGQATIRFPASLLGRRGDPKARQIVEGQINVFEARREALTSQAAILKQRVAQYSEEIVGIEGQIRAETEQLALLREELGDVRQLYKKGLTRKPRLLQLRRRAAEIEGSLNMRQAQIARARQSIAESRMRTADLETSMLNQVVEDLRKAQAELYDLNERVRAAKDVLARTDIRAPLAGTVVDLQVHTAGGVIAAGQPLLDIVPSDRRLVVEARVNPRDIDVVRQGLEAQVRFTAFNQRHRAPAVGTLTSVSADLLTDAASGEKYYLARVELVETQAASIDLDPLYPGMQAEVMIVTGARSALDYLLEPLLKSFNRAFRES
ncbi:MAG: HlyD family type I secretion periplasmic adaptor subunit [Proteobacteria bacterium]|nr:HlyD family type I secretion periplasmic adaptor subunit [Pseudomonadota bacterium]